MSHADRATDAAHRVSGGGAPVVLMMAKAPRPGRVKTRLAKAVGDERACAVYRWMVERQLSEIPRGWGIEVHFDPPGALEEVREWLGSRFVLKPQVAGDLGARMCGAVDGALAAGAAAAILVGGDCPDLDVRDLEEAFRRLEAGANAVFGPAADGGYYLLGLRVPQPQLFEGVPWSSGSTLEASLARARELGLKVAMLPEKEDLDTMEDFRRAVARGAVRDDW